MAEERKRRKALSGDTKKVGMSTSKAVLKMWLNDNPVMNATDLKFVRGEVMNFKTNLENFTSQRAKSKDLANSEGAGNLSGMAPFLCMIHATLEDDQACLQYQNILTFQPVNRLMVATTLKQRKWMCAGKELLSYGITVILNPIHKLTVTYTKILRPPLISLSTFLQRICGSSTLDGGEGPSLLKQKADKKQKLEDEEKAERQQMGHVITATTIALFVFNIEEMKKKIYELKERIFDAEDKRDDMVDAGVHSDRIVRQDKCIKTLFAALEGQQHALAIYHLSTASDTMGATISGSNEDE